MNRLRALIRFLKAGPFRGNHKPVRFDTHSYQAVGADLEDRYDVLMSARADREAEIAYWSSR